MTRLNQIRQGDVLLIAVDMGIPAGTEGKAEVILAEGEITGHAHRLTGGVIYEWEAGGQRYVRVAGDKPGKLSHEEHDPLPASVVAPETTYRIVQQHEWNLSRRWRHIRD